MLQKIKMINGPFALGKLKRHMCSRAAGFFQLGLAIPFSPPPIFTYIYICVCLCICMCICIYTYIIYLSSRCSKPQKDDCKQQSPIWKPFWPLILRDMQVDFSNRKQIQDSLYTIMKGQIPFQIGRSENV